MNRFAFFALAAAGGAVVGVITLVLIQLILLVQFVGFGEASEVRYAAIVAEQPAWRVIFVPTLGGLIVGLLFTRVPGTRYHGIADVMEACAMNSARMPTRSDVFAALAAAVSLGSGAPLGREGPAVHIGASMSAWMAERLQLDRSQSLALLGCGAAAAVTVSFNAPVAAVIFALEVIVGYYTLRVFADYALGDFWELPIFAIIGALGAGVVYLVIGVAHTSRAGWERVSIPQWLRPMFAGAVFGIVALQLPMVLSVGFEATDTALRSAMPMDLVVPLLVAKLVLVGLAIGSGCAGGVFSPAVFLGALLGVTVWLLMQWLGPAALAVASAMLGAPISTVLIVFEMTRDYDITVAVMVAAAVATTVMQSGPWGSFFRWQLATRSVNITTGRDISLLMTHQVKDLISDRYTTAPISEGVLPLQAQLGRERCRVALLLDENKQFVGSVSLAALLAHWHAQDDINVDKISEAKSNKIKKKKLRKKDDAAEAGSQSELAEVPVHPLLACMAPRDVAINSSTNIVNALNLMADRQLDYLPVVDNLASDEPLIQGIIMKSDLLSAHYDVVKQARQDEFGIT